MIHHKLTPTLQTLATLALLAGLPACGDQSAEVARSSPAPDAAGQEPEEELAQEAPPPRIEREFDFDTGPGSRKYDVTEHPPRSVEAESGEEEAQAVGGEEPNEVPDEEGQDEATGSQTTLVFDPKDLEGTNYPVRVVLGDGSVHEIADKAAMRALLESRKTAAGSKPPVEFVRLFYATDRAQLATGWRNFVRPLGPGLLILIVAVLGTVFMLRSLRKGLRYVAWLAGLAFVAISGFLFYRGISQNLELLRLARETDVIYGGDRNTEAVLEYGTVLVSIPAQQHDIARIERPSIFKGEIFADPLKHFLIDEIQVQNEVEFFSGLKAKVQTSPDHRAFVYVHGFNNTFAYAALRVAQIAYDLKFEGAPILYSWPSVGKIAGYTQDETNARWTEARLFQFLTHLRERSGAETVHLVAHSMGTRVLSEAVNRFALQSDQEQRSPLFDELILAAPDIDADTFMEDIAPQLMQRARRVTLYACNSDEALDFSKRINGNRRAGQAGDELIILPGMDSIDVTPAAGGHAYISNSGSVLSDLVAILAHGQPVQDRQGLRARKRGGLTYWELGLKTQLTR